MVKTSQGVTMALWIRFQHEGATDFGLLDGEAISVCEGDMFGQYGLTGQTVALGSVRVLLPCRRCHASA